MNDLGQKIQEYFNQEDVKNNLSILVQKYFINEKQKQGFLKVFELVKKGEFDCVDIADFLNEMYRIEIERALEINKELFDQVYGDVYDELQQLYEENKNKGNVEIEKEKSSQAAPQESDISQTELLRKYNIFIKLSLFQNILASQEMLMEKFMSVGAIHELPLQSNHDLPTQSIQNEFYQAINAGDKIKAVAVLRVLCAKGKLGSSFLNDKRYLDFWAGFLERHYGPDVKQKFLKNPIEKKYLLEFLRFILEKRLDFNLEESAMIGTGLAALCQESGEKEFEEMAFGDEEQGKFVWAE
ncbi:hypothetical protein COU23_00715 [Candidatus Kuenenbacteria bacterium CG10_big_fil_rev_8_21_14_0_10_36_11]|uniref:Uncharacterized protein n=1 Tax=Candidatus Kuenenbacteria bacterium CG10_big_fil_rev_8_21_14_0_10_36_11 TaxID=1974618 RepID=A0A2M6WB60_9BACT|nr:MAG: hypothetical protein COU23_00715 [Candidatus Kuenenbacteria bacterium CG10_big_fil_rev_8_21_14_0_10_36_11]